MGRTPPSRERRTSSRDGRLWKPICTPAWRCKEGREGGAGSGGQWGFKTGGEGGRQGAPHACIPQQRRPDAV